MKTTDLRTFTPKNPTLRKFIQWSIVEHDESFGLLLRQSDFRLYEDGIVEVDVLIQDTDLTRRFKTYKSLPDTVRECP